MPVGRNDVCPCGSGLKYKKCCAEKDARALPKGLVILLVAIAAVAALGLIPMLTSSSRDQAAQPGAAAVPAGGGYRPQPGPAPPGKVWSAEHGHWHDAPTRTAMPLQSPEASPIQITPGGTLTPGGPPPIQLNTPPQQQFTPAPQPPGPVPAGKVWSVEHGHWHDAPAQ